MNYKYVHCRVYVAIYFVYAIYLVFVPIGYIMLCVVLMCMHCVSFELIIQLKLSIVSRYTITKILLLYVVVEFIYAQSPAYMKGLLLGCLFFTEGFSMNLGSLLILSQSKGTSVYWEYLKSLPKFCDGQADDAGSCLATYTIIAISTLLGFLLFLYSAKNYKVRIRDTALRYYSR